MSLAHQIRTASNRFLLTISFAAVLGIAAPEEAPAQSPRAGAGQVVSVREFPLKPGVDAEKFETFVREKFNPTLERAVPGVKAYVAKADRGVGTGRYAYVIVFDSWNTRRAYIPDENMVADWFMERFYKPILPLFEELWTYADRNAWANFTDYAEVR